jgi:hypothetical protein
MAIQKTKEPTLMNISLNSSQEMKDNLQCRQARRQDRTYFAFAPRLKIETVLLLFAFMFVTSLIHAQVTNFDVPVT